MTEPVNKLVKAIIIFAIRKSKFNLIGLDQGSHDRTC